MVINSQNPPTRMPFSGFKEIWDSSFHNDLHERDINTVAHRRATIPTSCIPRPLMSSPRPRTVAPEAYQKAGKNKGKSIFRAGKNIETTLNTPTQEDGIGAKLLPWDSNVPLTHRIRRRTSDKLVMGNFNNVNIHIMNTFGSAKKKKE
jgi:hypothetical protein